MYTNSNKQVVVIVVVVARGNIMIVICLFTNDLFIFTCTIYCRGTVLIIEQVNKQLVNQRFSACVYVIITSVTLFYHPRNLSLGAET